MNDVAGRVITRVWRDGEMIMPNCPAELVPDFLGEEGYLVWVDLCEPTHEQLARLEQELALDPLAIEDAVANLERTKAIRYGTYTVLTAYATYLDPVETTTATKVEVRSRRNPTDDDLPPESVLRLDRLSMFVLPRGVVTIRRHPGSTSKRSSTAPRTTPTCSNTAPVPWCTAFSTSSWTAISTQSRPWTTRWKNSRTACSTTRPAPSLCNAAPTNSVKTSSNCAGVTLPMRDVVNGVLRHRRESNSTADLNSLYDDLYDHVLRVAEWTESLRDMVTTIFETNLSLQDARLNTVMKKLTAWAAIIAVPTAVTGYFGQNIPYPGFGDQWGFVLSAVSIIVIASALYLLFRRKEWL